MPLLGCLALGQFPNWKPINSATSSVNPIDNLMKAIANQDAQSDKQRYTVHLSSGSDDPDPS